MARRLDLKDFEIGRTLGTGKSFLTGEGPLEESRSLVTNEQEDIQQSRF